MEFGQELTHSVTTTVSSDKQTVVNETRLLDGDEVIIDTKHTVSLPIGKKYDLEMKGDVNGQTVRRTLNVLNNLLGTDAFNFKDLNEATDAGALQFTASYDSLLSKLSGTAPVGSVIRVVFEDDINVKIVPSATGDWEYLIDLEKLNYGNNSVILINGNKDSEVIVLNIERKAPVVPFIDGVSYEISADGSLISGVAVDARAMITVSVDKANYTAQANLMGGWAINLPSVLKHGQDGVVRASLGDVSGDEQLFTFYKKTAELDQANGQGVTGTARPMAEVIVTTGRYGSIAVVADDSGLWSASFVGGLRNGAAVIVSIDDEVLTAFAYAGVSDVVYSFTAEIATSKLITGTAPPAHEITLESTSNGKVTVTSDADGNWMANMTNALFSGESISISSVTDAINLTFNPPAITANFVSAKRLTGTGLRGETVTISTDSGAMKTGVIDALGKWTITLDTDLVNFQKVTINDSFNSIELTYVAFTGVAVTKTQINGTALAGSAVSVSSEPENIVYAGSDSRWKMILNTALEVGESVTMVNQGKSLEVRYKPEFTAYINADGGSVVGTSSESQVTIEINGIVTQINVISGEFKHELTEVLEVGDGVLVHSGTETKQLTYSSLTVFTASLNPGLSAVTGSVNGPAKIRAVFTDNSIVEKSVESGEYTLELGRVLSAGVDVIVVACIANNELYQAVTLEA